MKKTEQMTFFLNYPGITEAMRPVLRPQNNIFLFFPYKCARALKKAAGGKQPEDQNKVFQI